MKLNRNNSKLILTITHYYIFTWIVLNFVNSGVGSKEQMTDLCISNYIRTKSILDSDIEADLTWKLRKDLEQPR